MELQQPPYFVTVAEYRHFGRAAEAPSEQPRAGYDTRRSEMSDIGGDSVRFNS